MPLYWDQPYQNWDSDLTWDAGDSPTPGDLTSYLNLITSEHNDKPNFMAGLAAILQPLVDNMAILNAMVPTYFDIDQAVGDQLDIIGLWVGANRYLTEPITGVFFTFNTGPGFNAGILRGPHESLTQLIRLPDEQYRTLIKATIAANHWDGTVVGAYNAYAIAFGPGGYRLTITDHQDMTIDLTLSGPNPDALTRALFLGGYLNLRPDGVAVANYIISPTP